MDDHVFLSYSKVDGSAFVLRLVDPLTAGPPPFSVWFDQRRLRAGAAWDRQLVEAIRECRAVLFVMTRDSVLDSSVCKREWIRALKYKKSVIPLLVDSEAELPFQLEPRQYIDFTDSFEEGLARLRQHLVWMDSSEGVLQALIDRREDAERELPRARDLAQRARTQRELEELDRQIAEQRRLLDNPQAASQRTEERIASGLEREREPEQPPVLHRAKFVNPPPVIAPTWFQDRKVETEVIGDFLKDEGLRLLTVVGRGGVGKTVMVCRLLKTLERGQLPDDLGPLGVDGIVYLSPVGVHRVSFPDLFADLTKLLPKEEAQRLDQLYQDPHKSTREQMLALLEAFPTGRTVLLLDNFEDVIDSETLTITDTALDEALQTVLTAPTHGVKVILTTRVAPEALLLVQPALQHRLNLDEGLPSPYAENILRAMDRDGTLGLTTATDAQLDEARERTRGYPRALEALVAILAADRNTSLPDLLAETDKLLPKNVVEALVGEAFNRLDPLAQQVMQALAVYGRPVPPVAVDYLLQPYLLAIDSAPVLGRLVNMQFVRRDAGRYYLHQVDRDYALSRIPPGQPTDREGLERPFTRYALLARGADYFQQTGIPRESWKQLDDVASQLAEFELRYQGEDYDNASAVLVGFDVDYLLVWGHYRLMVQLHERLRGKITDPDLQQSNMGNLGVALLSMGQYQQAIDHYEEALALAQSRHVRSGECAWLTSLGGCYQMLGEVRRAIGYYEKALAIAREMGYQSMEAMALTCLGISDQMLGEVRRAIGYQEQALAIAREIDDRESEGVVLASLGDCYDSLGEIRRAIDLCEQGLAIARELGDRGSEAGRLSSLGDCYRSLGEVRRAIDLYEEGLAIARELGSPYAEATHLIGLGHCEADREAWERAIQRYDKAIRIADEISFVAGQSESHNGLAKVYLFQGELSAARQVAETARTYDYPSNAADAWTILGVVLLRDGMSDRARSAFTEALVRADALLHHTSDNYHALDTKALALCGLALLGDSARLTEAMAAIRAARAIIQAAGVVRDVSRLFNALAVQGEGDALDEIRAIANSLPGGYS
jgi:tetratricopeptide (TPR) repeat protein